MNAPAIPERLPDEQAAPDPYFVYLDALQSPESKRTMRGCLDRIARLITGDPEATGAGQPWGLLRYEHTVRLRTLMREQGWSAAHVNKHLVALRRVLQEAWRLGLMTGEEFQRAADLPSYKHTRVPVGQHVPPEVLEAALEQCEDDHSPAGRRDGAMLAVLYSTGCRRAELAALKLSDFDRPARSLRVRGKGDKERLVYLTAEAVERVELWLSERGREAGPLFCPINKAGRLRLSHMTGQAIADIVSRRLTQAGAAKRTPHDFRRTFIGELLDAGVDLATTQALVGHASPATTARYDRRPERRRREAVDRLKMPGTARPR
ncbi:tyrosine-type recombinase/integrase [Planotetraspora sp. A-T 1434]|uniref:tyrosine-type recombinase/integrase n=1 Tax=Planotetraspora sp. A-T 1434 TaxID=2979219 RepID=UPI0021C16C46|nr:tyrosine-type recombinase/integrase [Planotetraspora sp. A-T 1434]MCT9930384.1 tyrosine-type recombinase/integrase [Planotetraspora sp. A-T 1434]